MVVALFSLAQAVSLTPSPSFVATRLHRIIASYAYLLKVQPIFSFNIFNCHWNAIRFPGTAVTVCRYSDCHCSLARMNIYFYLYFFFSMFRAFGSFGNSPLFWTILNIYGKNCVLFFSVKIGSSFDGCVVYAFHRFPGSGTATYIFWPLEVIHTHRINDFRPPIIKTLTIGHFT